MKYYGYYLYAVVVRPEGTIFRQRVCKVKDDLSQEERRQKLNSYQKILGTGYQIVDWYIDV